MGGSILSNMSVHREDAGVSVASVISSVAEVLHGDERSEGFELVCGQLLLLYYQIHRLLMLGCPPDLH